jgi:hypothetical protein
VLISSPLGFINVNHTNGTWLLCCLWFRPCLCILLSIQTVDRVTRVLPGQGYLPLAAKCMKSRLCIQFVVPRMKTTTTHTVSRHQPCRGCLLARACCYHTSPKSARAPDRFTGLQKTRQGTVSKSLHAPAMLPLHIALTLGRRLVAGYPSPAGGGQPYTDEQSPSFSLGTSKRHKGQLGAVYACTAMRSWRVERMQPPNSL